MHIITGFIFVQMDNSMGNNYKLPLRFVWGILPADNGDYMNPFSKGTLELDKSFDMSAPESQSWLLAFCRNLRTQPFYLSTLGPLLPNCFIESFYSWMQRRCIDTIDKIDRTPCCEGEDFPYERHIFEGCIIEAMADLYETPSEYFMPGMAGPKFSKPRNADHVMKIQAVVVEYDSNYTFSMSFPYMRDFYNQVEDWIQEQLKTAPSGMKNGWFVSEFHFFDLQRVLSDSTVFAIAIAMIVSFTVLLLVTLNILISMYAILTISCSIFATVAILVLLGWKLNVLESIAVSTAIGLAVDFCLHYGINYKLMSVENNRKAATRSALGNMAGPTAMTAITTAMAGALMLSSSVLAYIQIGIFLVVVMAVSWLYATFLFGAILSIAGPERGFGQFHYPVMKLCKSKPDLEPDTSSADTRTSRASKNICQNVISETTLSTTSIVALPNSESHELDSLTGRGNGSYSAGNVLVKASGSGIFKKGDGSKCNKEKYFETEQSHSVASDVTVMIDD